MPAEIACPAGHPAASGPIRSTRKSGGLLALALASSNRPNDFCNSATLPASVSSATVCRCMPRSSNVTPAAAKLILLAAGCDRAQPDRIPIAAKAANGRA